MATKFIIGIQARSSSTRFPNKIFELIGKQRVLDHVVDRAMSASRHINRYQKFAMSGGVAILYPTGDDAVLNGWKFSGCLMVPGPELDVLARYVEVQRQTGADYIVRLTSDCPMHLDFIISKHMSVAVGEGYDYVSNVEESCRTIADGFDCEVMSSRALKWLDENAKESSDREHVTTALRRVRPRELRQTFIASKFDTSSIKMSVDTPEDLARIRTYYHQLEKKQDNIQGLFGNDFYSI